jgi:hypothetical protein
MMSIVGTSFGGITESAEAVRFCRNQVASRQVPT